jgi:hypothetical protein
MKRNVFLTCALLLCGCGPMLEHAVLQTRYEPPPPLRHLERNDIVILTSTGPTQLERYKMTGYRIAIGQNDVVQYEMGTRNGVAHYFEHLNWMFAGIDKAMPLSKMKMAPCSDKNFTTPTFLRVGNQVSPDLRCVDGEQLRSFSQLFYLLDALNGCLLKYADDDLFALNTDCYGPDRSQYVRKLKPGESKRWALPAPMPEG